MVICQANRSPSVDVAIVSVRDVDWVVLDDDLIASIEVAARVRVLTSELNEAIGEVAIVVLRGPAVVQVVVVVKRQDLLWVELCAKEWIAVTLHRGNESISGLKISRDRGRSEHAIEAFIAIEGVQSNAVVV